MENFHKAVKIYIDRPQVVNRRCAGSVLVSAVTSCDDVTSTSQRLDNLTTLICDAMKDEGCLYLDPSLISVITPYTTNYVELSVRKILSKQSHVKFPHEIIIQGLDWYYFIPVEVNGESSLCAVGVSYYLDVSADSGSVSTNPCIQVTTFSHPQLCCKTTSSQWLHHVLLPKLNKWASQPAAAVTKSVMSDSQETDGRPDELVSTEKYFEKYTRMKDVYGKAICEIWPECTDPLKFVYEDVAIASYLICLWEKEMEENSTLKRPSFVDVGCGNGLLVYILTAEGFSGYGIDIRKRAIWDMFGDKADLREMSLIPSDSKLFSTSDWLIGNHSDELTPWIPVMAARSSRNCRFFLLPCCPFDFYGKYQRSDASKSIYLQYLDYVCHITKQCGFIYQTDSLRIPSTRKQCIIGLRKKNIPESEYQLLDTEIDNMTSSNNSGNTSLSSSTTFTPRAQVEPVRNCSTVSKALQQQIVRLVSDRLLATISYKSTTTGGTWNCGGTLDLSEVADMCKSQNLLQPLKAECGGIKTLLKNHHYIFKVTPEKGRYLVRLNDYTINRKEKTPTSRYKTKLCWFFTSHPDGCLLSADSCQYAHGEGDIRSGS
ncbi:TRMT44 [Bugula neritina]|uniref:tRNA (uracil-O(2)-)-methyltransferase n=1 Tax=Bugula neritina TaxID=10212 RepID=A0A7J7KBM6_BUGNE|nr:TRMT44 [Bugula neritina]